MALTCVSAYFQVGNKHGDKYKEWFHNTLSINCPYVIFTNRENIEMLRYYRGGYPTHFVECEIHDFYTYKYKDLMITNDVDCPSVELNLIWNEKIFMIKKAYELNPFGSEWFKWIDAGLCIYRNETPPQHSFPNMDKLNNLPKDKFIYSSSIHNECHDNLVRRDNYYHHISGTYMLHSSFIDNYTNLYKEYMDYLVDRHNIWTDQVIHTHIYKDYKHLFYKLCDGYGEMTRRMF